LPQTSGKNSRLPHLLLDIFIMAIIAVSAQAQVPVAYFGMQATSGVALQPPQWWSNPWPAVPIGSLRLWDAGVAWAQINKTEGVYDWTLLDEWLQDVQKFNVQEVMYTFGETPQWASSHPNDPVCAWGPGECDAPKDLNPDGSGPDQLWKNYVAAIAGRSAGRIKYWEVWNEPKNAYYWNGTVAQLVRMAKDAREVILSIDPQAVMLTPPSHGPWQTLYFAAGGPRYADIITYHGYTYKSGCIGFPRAADELQIVSGVRQVMATYGQSGKPLWDTETSWGVTSASCFYNSDLQSAFLAQLFILHWSADVKRVFWYQYNNQINGTLWTPNPDPHHRNYTGTLRKAGIAYEQVYKWMGGMDMPSPCSVSGTLWSCNFSGPGGYLAEAMWDTSQTCHDGSCSSKNHAVGSQYTNYLTLDGDKINITNGEAPVGAKPIWMQNQ
jgi:polysaccharide biosynthesis protein PslG